MERTARCRSRFRLHGAGRESKTVPGNLRPSFQGAMEGVRDSSGTVEARRTIALSEMAMRSIDCMLSWCVRLLIPESELFMAVCQRLQGIRVLLDV